METQWRGALRTSLLLLAIFSSGTSSFSEENDRDFKFCGDWRHGNSVLSLTYDLIPGCGKLSISANESSLSVRGKITAQCQRSGTINLSSNGFDSRGQSHFCVYWEPLLDKLWLEVGARNHTLCWPAGLQESCCTDLSNGANEADGAYGIANGTVRTDVYSDKTRTAYTFYGGAINCVKTFCDGADQVTTIEETLMRSQAVGSVALPCALSYVVEMKDDFQGYSVTLPASEVVSAETIPVVHLSSSLKPAENTTGKVVCTFFKNSPLFQSPSEEEENDVIVEDVVGITVENQVISNLPEPIRIAFQHSTIPRTHSRKCVSWDTRKDPMKVTWRQDGCTTVVRGAGDTDCHCNHLTYFTILVQLEHRPVRHLMALSVITSLGCAASTISCVAILIFLTKKRRSKEQSTPVHLGLAIALFFLYLLFFFTGTLANIGGEGLCRWVGAALHYALLSSFSWMAAEVFHTFWLVYVVFSPTPKLYVWNLIGFGLPAVPVIILAAVGNIYGVREVLQVEDINNPYLMCWMKTNPEGLLSHYFTNVTAVAVLLVSGLVMLLLVYRQIRVREEWRQNRVAFLSIWGLSCLFGTGWGLAFLDFGPFPDVVLFLFCIINSFQGFFLMLRFYLLEWMRKQTGSSANGPSSTGSTRQHMLQAQEKS